MDNRIGDSSNLPQKFNFCASNSHEFKVTASSQKRARDSSESFHLLPNTCNVKYLNISVRRFKDETENNRIK